MRPAAPHTEALNKFERVGLRWMLGYSETDRPALSHWPEKVLKRIRRIERMTLIQASLLGGISGLLFAMSELGLQAWFGEDREGLAEQLSYWALFAFLGLLISGAEIAVLYWRILRAVGSIGTRTGLNVDRGDTERMIVLGISRAALDMPNPRAEVHGVDPYSRLPRWKMIMYAVFYRLKVGATSMMIRMILRRVLARAALRSLIPFAAIGVYAFWNAVIIWLILKQTRMRTAGPVAIKDLDELIKDDCPKLEEHERKLLFEAIGESVILNQDAHPNYVLFLGQLLDRCNPEAEKIDGKWEESKLRDANLSNTARRVLLRCLTTATILRGSPRKDQVKFLEKVADILGRGFDKDALDKLQSNIYAGKGVNAELLDAVTPEA